MSGLRDEIIESQKVRSELLKWKLLIVSALGAAGLGFTEHSNSGDTGGSAYLVLLLIPLVCFYVDLLCKHLVLRIKVIGAFIRIGCRNEEAAYEYFVGKINSMGHAVFVLEDWALQGSTIILSILVIIAGLILPEMMQMTGGRVLPKCLVQGMFVVSGLTGLVLTLIVQRRIVERTDALDVLSRNQDVVDEIKSIIADNTFCPEGSPSKPEHG